MILTKDKNFYRELLMLAIPMAIGNLVTFLITLTDSIMIGRLGDNAVSGAYIGGVAATFVTMFITGIEGGITVGASRSFGKGDPREIKKIIGIGTALIMLFGVLVTIVCFAFPEGIVSLFLKGDSSRDGAEYLKLLSLSFPLFCLSGAISSSLRAIGKPSTGTYAAAAALITKVIFNYLLIFGKLNFTKMGISGAAVATVIARAVEAFFLLIYIFFIEKGIKLRPKDFVFLSKSTGASFIKYTLPILGGQLVWIANTFFSSFIFGKIGDEAIMAALAVANTLGSLSYIIMNGLSAGTGILIGKTIGEGGLSKIREYSYTVEVIFIILGLLTSASLLLLRAPFIALYNISGEAKATAAALIGVLALTIIGTTYQAAALSGLVKSGGDVSFILKNDAAFIFLGVVPLTLALVKLGAPVWLVFLALKSDQILKCLPAAIKINRFNWIKKLP